MCDSILFLINNKDICTFVYIFCGREPNQIAVLIGFDRNAAKNRGDDAFAQQRKRCLARRFADADPSWKRSNR